MSGGGNWQKTWLADSLTRLAQQKALSAIQRTGKALPCSVVSVSGQIVTVQFEVQSGFTLPQVTMPIATSFYDWLPIQPGDTGITLPADVYLGGISGLGGGTANLTQRGNLATLMFVPCARQAWAAANPNQRIVQGPAGALIQDTAGNSTINLESGQITINCAGNTVTISAAGVVITPSVSATIAGELIVDGTTTFNGNVTVATGYTLGVNGTDFTTHVHSGVTTGSGDTGPPVAGT